MELRLDTHLPFRKRGRFSSDEGDKNKDSGDDSNSNSSKKQRIESDSGIRCPCGGEDSVGLMIQCESCNAWQHCACVGITKKNVPESYYCEVCRPDEDDSRTNFLNKEVADAVVYLSHLEALSLAYSKGDLMENQPVPYAFVGEYGPEQEMLSAGPDGRLLRIIPRVIIVCRIIEQYGTEATYDQVLTGYKKKFPHRTADWAQETVKMLLSFRDNHFRFALVPPSSYRLETTGVDIEEIQKSLTEMRARRIEAELAVAKGDREEKPNPNAPGMQRINRRLPRNIVEILDRWFDKHNYDPYPNKHEKAVLAERTGLSLEKISAWFEQKRYRLKKNFQEKPKKPAASSRRQSKNNTFSVLPNIVLEPMHRNDSCDGLLALAMVSQGEQAAPDAEIPQRKTSGSLGTGEANLASAMRSGFDNTNRNSYVSLSSLHDPQHTPNSEHMITPRGMVSRGSERDFSTYGEESLSIEVRSVNSGKSRRLPANALEKLEAWYEQHVHDPYPTDADKASLAESTGLSVEQISAWFHNKRYKKRIAKHAGGLVEGPVVDETGPSPTLEKIVAPSAYASFHVPSMMPRHPPHHMPAHPQQSRFGQPYTFPTKKDGSDIQQEPLRNNSTSPPTFSSVRGTLTISDLLC